MNAPRMAFASLLFSLAARVPAPKQAYTPDQIAGIDTVEEIMRVQAHEADPLFAVRDQGSFSDAEFSAMAAMASKLDASSLRLKGFAGSGDYDDGFAEYAGKLNAQAKALGEAAEAKDAAAAGGALNAMKAVCRDCHGVYK